MHIVVASSNIFRRELSSFILSEAGYTVDEVCDSRSLIGYLDQQKPDMVLLDTRLSGFEEDNHHIMYAIHSHRSIPILLLTSALSPLNIPKALATASDDSVAWPYQVEDFLSHVQDCLHRCARETHATTLAACPHPTGHALA